MRIVAGCAFREDKSFIGRGIGFDGGGFWHV
jgi:hypothetical protein